MSSGNKLPLLFLKPVLKETVWGGFRLRQEFGYGREGDRIGECWGIAARPEGDSFVYCKEPCERFSELTLSRLWKKEPGIFGGYAIDYFPLLVKIIDAKSDLSIQVHPDNAYAVREENGSSGKMECWYIIDCPKDAMLVAGHNARTKKELEEMIRCGKWDKLIRKIPIEKGDFIQINPGTVHAITAGCLILETQQSSNVTYRLYDYGRKVDGVPRELHIKKGMDVIQVPSAPVKDFVVKTGNLPENRLCRLVSCQYYTVYKLVVSGEYTMSNSEVFLNLSVLEGEGAAECVPIKKGEHFIVPANYGALCLKGNLEIIISCVKYESVCTVCGLK